MRPWHCLTRSGVRPEPTPGRRLRRWAATRRRGAGDACSSRHRAASTPMQCTLLMLSRSRPLSQSLCGAIWHAPGALGGTARCLHTPARACELTSLSSSCPPSRSPPAPAGATWGCAGWTRRWQPCRACRWRRSGERRSLQRRSATPPLPAHRSCVHCPSAGLVGLVGQCSRANFPALHPAACRHAYLLDWNAPAAGAWAHVE